MGDLVRSSETEDRRSLHAAFNACVADANERFAAVIASPLTITLGDEFQGLTVSLERAFEVDHFVRTVLLREGIESRVVAGKASIETEVNTENAWNMLGRGLAEARNKLGEKKDPNAYRFSFPDDEELELLLDAVGRSLTRIEAGWTDTQLRYVLEVLTQPDRARSETAQALGVSENSLYKVLRSADFRFYTEQLATIRTVLRLEDEKRKAA
jgi:hypothetical protein